jgi:acetylornithine deacetylase/succinyl-diaminopimelate desuccinylase-like protein
MSKGDLTLQLTSSGLCCHRRTSSICNPHSHRTPTQKTVLIYGHYDVQPASISDGWNSEPFELTLKPDPENQPEGNVKMYGRGSSDDKGPVLGWINVLEALISEGTELPVRTACARWMASAR